MCKFLFKDSLSKKLKDMEKKGKKPSNVGNRNFCLKKTTFFRN